MKQLPLLTIRQQPIQPEPKIPSRTIRQYVRENLRDFAKRQAERERVRKAYQAAQARQPAKKRTEEHIFMRTISITYRAIFEQPRGPLNPMGLKLAGPQPVEVFRKGEHWYARELSTPRRNVLERLGKLPSADQARTTVELAFASTVIPWQIWGSPPSESTTIRDFRPAERVLQPDEICDLGDGKAGWYTAEDRTHIIHPPGYSEKFRVPPAACGATGLPSKCFVNNRANVEPSCKGCAEVWRREYKDR